MVRGAGGVRGWGGCGAGGGGEGVADHCGGDPLPPPPPGLVV